MLFVQSNGILSKCFYRAVFLTLISLERRKNNFRFYVVPLLLFSLYRMKWYESKPTLGGLLLYCFLIYCSLLCGGRFRYPESIEGSMTWTLCIHIFYPCMHVLLSNLLQGTYVEGIKEEVVLSPAHALSLIASGEGRHNCFLLLRENILFNQTI